jgi:hypothetical protein
MPVTNRVARDEERTQLPSLGRFLADVHLAWRTYKFRAVLGIAGIILFAWSALPITTME